jgi:signal transduction histidine kinase
VRIGRQVQFDYHGSKDGEQETMSRPGALSATHSRANGKTVAVKRCSIAQQGRLLEQIRAGRKRAQVFSQMLLEAQEAERRQLARELHDEIGQALTAVKINLQAVRQAPDMQSRLEESIGIVERALEQVRNLSLNLRPTVLDDLGLVAAMRWYTNRQAQRAGLAIRFVAEAPRVQVSPAVEAACFRIAQEALTNIVRHAQASLVHVELRRGKVELQLVVRDDGCGFDVAAVRRRTSRGYSCGLLGMSERALLIGGQVEIRSKRGQGTEVNARFPLAPALAVERRSKRRKR